MNIEIGAPVRTRDRRHIGHVHRVLVDLDDNSATAVVVLKGREARVRARSRAFARQAA